MLRLNECFIVNLSRRMWSPDCRRIWDICHRRDCRQQQRLPAATQRRRACPDAALLAAIFAIGKCAADRQVRAREYARDSAAFGVNKSWLSRSVPNICIAHGSLCLESVSAFLVHLRLAGRVRWVGAQSAVELCDIGALKQLLSLMETHWKQLGQAVTPPKC